tara:strand:- start:1507 stop:3474 length:1968 start_codon:yes stop_codon:yes gene_type:complete
VHVFDEEYVLHNLHVGESITRENKRNLLPLVLGKDGVTLARHITSLDQEQRQVAEVLRENSNLIRTKFPSVQDSQISQYCRQEIPSDLAKQIADAERKLTLARQAAEIQKKTDPQPLKLPAWSMYQALLSDSIDTLSADAQQLVSEHIQKHNLDQNAERWIQYGHDHSDLDTCPYCDQSLQGVELISAYRTYFGEKFTQLLSLCDGMHERLSEFIRFKIPSVLASNASDFDYWDRVIALPEKPHLEDADVAAIEAGLTIVLKLLEQKRASPLEAIRFDAGDNEVNRAFELIAQFNSSVGEITSLVQKARDQTQVSDAVAAQSKLDRLLALNGRTEDSIRQAALDYVAAEDQKKDIETKKKAAQKSLKETAEKSANVRQTEINELLSDFGASFRIENTSANFKGREPNAEFMIAIGGFKVPAGEKSNTAPSFGTILSAGDKTTLALAFFLSQIKSDPLLSQSIIAFDDPFNSQDLNRQFETTSQIRAIAKLAKQVIVLSHDPRFLHMIEKDADHGSTSALQIQCSEEGFGALEKWSSERELASQYLRRSERIREFARQKNLLDPDSDETLHQAIRPFLEDYLRNRFPGRFGDSTHLFEMANIIEGAGNQDPMFSHVHDLQELNNYSRRSMHGGDSQSSPDELQAQCRKVVRIVGEY